MRPALGEIARWINPAKSASPNHPDEVAAKEDRPVRELSSNPQFDSLAQPDILELLHVTLDDQLLGHDQRIHRRCPLTDDRRHINVGRSVGLGKLHESAGHAPAPQIDDFRIDLHGCRDDDAEWWRRGRHFGDHRIEPEIVASVAVP